MKRLFVICLLLMLLAIVPRGSAPPGLKVGSKQFTESVILGEILSQTIRDVGEPANHLADLGGTRIVFDALRRGEIDLYPEYTGTLLQEIFASQPAASPNNLAALLQREGIGATRSLGFSNGYALAVRRETAEQLNLVTIADLAAHPELRLGFSNEFLDREDGWKNLRKHYNLSHRQVSGRNHDLAYRQLEAKTIDVMDVYETDAQLAQLDLVLLEDNLHYFPKYDAIVLFRAELGDRYPNVVERLYWLEGRIAPEDIRKLNAQVMSREQSPSQAAAEFLRDKLALNSEVEDISVAAQIWQRTLEHCDLVRRSLIPAIFAAIPLGIFAAKQPRLGQIVLGVVGIVQTIPALALLVLLIAPVAYLKLNTIGSDSATAIVALFLYSLLPIVRNTATGLTSIAPEYRESAAALGLSPMFRLFHVELPLALPSIMAGIKTAAILNVGFATLGALIGADGYGQPILTGIRLNDTSLILQGAVPAACMAILFQILFELAERLLLPAGLRPLAIDSDHATSH